MCTLAIYFQSNPDYPIVVAANRDEFYDRAALPPRRLGGDPWIIGGQDIVAGGTWLGVNADAMLAGILNRRAPHPPDPTLRSRGVLCLEMLQESTVANAVAKVSASPGRLYNPFNLLIASPTAAAVVGNITGHMVATALQPGLHLLTNLELNDPECPRIAKSYALFDAVGQNLGEGDLAALLAALRGILSDHSTPLDPRSEGLPNNLCVHTDRFGTRSSTVLIYGHREHRFRMWHADGAPCQAPFVEIVLPS